MPPNIIDETSSGDTLATEGRSVTLNCDATGTPRYGRLIILVDICEFLFFLPDQQLHGNERMEKKSVYVNIILQRMISVMKLMNILGIA